MADTLTADTLLAAYGAGIFPMADSADDPDIFWVDPQRRGILPLTPFHVPRRLRRTVKQDPFRVTVDRAFDRVVDGCAGPRQAAGGTWINDAIRALYEELFRRGHAHSVECWLDDELVGGLYGVNLGAAFFGESMFSRVRDASKVALVHLVARLIVGGYELLDTQFTNAHLEQFGVLEIDRVAYHRLLRRATSRQGDFFARPEESSGAAALQVINQTS